MKQLAFMLPILLFYGTTHAQCGVTVDAGPDIHFCQGDQEPHLQGSITGDYWWKHWTPVSGLDNGAVFMPNVQNITSNRKYTLQASGWSAQNLVPNGDFEQGNTGFYSELAYNNDLTVPGRYTITTLPSDHDPLNLSGCPDHTTGSGNMFLANTSTAVDYQILRFNIPATMNRQYRLRFWVMNPKWGGGNQCRIRMYLNGGPGSPGLGPFIVMPGNQPVCEWVMYEYPAFCNYNTIALQFFIDNNHTGQKKGWIAIDDISIVEECTAEDEAEVFFHAPQHTYLTKTICDGDTYPVGDQTFGSDGNYEVQVPNQWGCDSTVHLNLHTVKVPVTINPADPAFNCITPNILLTGSNPGGFPPGTTTLLWTTSGGGSIIGNPNAQNIWAASPGTYKLKVSYSSNGLSCADSTSVEVTVAQDVPTAEAGPPKLIGCTSPNAVLAGKPPTDASFLISWSTPNGLIVSGGNTATPTVGAAGTYIIKVTNPNNGCARTDTTTVAQNSDIPLANAGPPTLLDCAVSTATLAGQAATGANFEYTWSTPDGHFLSGQNSLAPLVDQPGQYFLSVLNKNNGCVGTSSVTIAQDVAKPDAQIGQPFTLNCYAPTALIVGNSSSGFPPQWSTVGGHFVSGTNTFQPIVDEAGAYFLKITNPGNHCETTVSVQISKNITNPTVGIASPSQLTCANPAATLFGYFSNGGPSPAINWTTNDGQISGGQNSPNPTVSALGTYLMTVTNTENGCSSSTQATVGGDVTLPVFSIAQPARLNCYNNSVVLSATPGNFTYQWATANGQIVSGWNSPFAAVNAPGSYQLVVTSNLNGCTSASLVTVQQTQPPLVEIFSVQNPHCFGQNSGMASAGAGGGFGNYTFYWSSGEVGNFAQNLPSGVVSVTVTDADFCTSTATTFLAPPVKVTLTASATAQTMANQNDGTANASASGGAGGFTFLWPNGQTTESISGLAPGSYTVTTTDGNGCTAVATAIVGAAACQVSLSGTAVATTCNGSATGSVSVQLFNPTGQTSYFWSNGQTGAQIGGLAAGFYTVTAQDANGCTSTQTFTVGQPAPLSLSETHQNVQCPNDLSGSATVAASGGTAGYSFLWENGATGPTLSGIGAGTYSVAATDANGCTKALSVEIKSADLVPPVVLVKNRTFSIDQNGKATLIASDFNNGSTDNCGIVNWTAQPPSFDCSELGVHDVTLTATDGAGNSSSATAQATITDNTPPTLTCPANKEAWSCNAAVAFPYPVALDNCLGNGGQFEFLSGLQSGSVFPIGVTANTWKFTDGSGNASTCSFTVTIFDKPTVTVSQVLPACHGDCNGSLSAVVSGGAGPFTFKWEDGQSTPALTGICTGYHLVTVTDGGGCNAYEAVFLDEPAALAISNPLIVNDIGGSGIGSITVSVGGGTPGYVYQWTKGGQFFSTNQNLTGLKTGEYVLKIIDANNCVLLSQKFFVDNLTSASEPDWAGGMVLLPNPTSGRAELVFPKVLGKNIRVEAFDATGRLVSSEIFDGFQMRCPLDFGEQPAGAYQLRISVGGAVAVRQLIKQ